MFLQSFHNPLQEECLCCFPSLICGQALALATARGPSRLPSGRAGRRCARRRMRVNQVGTRRLVLSIANVLHLAVRVVLGGGNDGEVRRAHVCPSCMQQARLDVRAANVCASCACGTVSTPSTPYLQSSVPALHASSPPQGRAQSRSGPWSLRGPLPVAASECV